MTSNTDTSDYHRRLLRRLVISYFDLTEARKSLERLRQLEEFDVPPANRSHDFIAHSTCLVVSYARPFTKSEGVTHTLSELPVEVRRDFSTEDQELHKRLLTLRNKEFAHSDPGVSDLKVTIREVGGQQLAIPISRTVRHSLTAKDIDRIDGMIGSVLNRLMEGLEDIPAKLEVGDQF